jgi:hypothetical protein
MKQFPLVFAMGIFASAQLLSCAKSTAGSSGTLAHTHAEFEFRIDAGYEVVAPLFGPEAERRWGGEHWDPEFLYPDTARDTTGAVFTVTHDGMKSTWVNTLLDMENGKVQYVCYLSGAVVTLININITKLSPAQTRVEVSYERTALKPEANDHVKVLGENDKGSGKEWAEAITDCLKKEGKISK